jgi:hypothetical protein
MVFCMSEPASPLSDKSPEELVLMKRWVETWKRAGPELERIRREELRKVNTFQALSCLMGPVDFTQEPFRPRPSSGLVQQQALFKKRGR